MVKYLYKPLHQLIVANQDDKKSLYMGFDGGLSNYNWSEKSPEWKSQLTNI